MKKVIDVENRKQFINEMIEKSKVDKDYLVITTEERAEDFILVDNVIVVTIISSINDYAPEDDVEIVIDLSSDKSEDELVSEALYYLPNDLTVITANKERIEYLLKE